MAFGITGERHLPDALPLHHAGAEQIQRSTERPDGAFVTANEQDAPDLRVTHRALQKITGLRETCQSPRRDVGYRIKAGAPQPSARGDNVVMRHAVWVIDEHRRARIEQLAQRLAGVFVARRDTSEKRQLFRLRDARPPLRRFRPPAPARPERRRPPIGIDVRGVHERGTTAGLREGRGCQFSALTVEHDAGRDGQKQVGD